MKTIDTTQIVDPTSQQPFSGKSLAFLQTGTKEGIAGAVAALIGSAYSATTVYVLNRCRISGAVIDNGTIFYGGEVYTFIGADTTAYTNVPVISFQQPYDTAIDPVLFSDGASKYVHELPQFYISDGLTGSTPYGDYADVVFIINREVTVLTPAAFSLTTAPYMNYTGAQFTCPDHKCNVKVTMECDVRVPKVTDGKIGFGVNVSNLTTAGNYTETRRLDMNDTYGGTTRTFPFIFTTYLTAIAAGTSLGIRLNLTQTDTHVLENSRVTYEVY